jgi:hypothetical protein
MGKMLRKGLRCGIGLLLAAVCLMIGAAGHGQSGSAEKGAQDTPSLSGFHSGIRTPQQAVIRNAREWAALWRRHAPDSRAPTVDFRRYHVVAVFAGTKPTGGFEVVIGEIQRGVRGATVHATLIKPGKGAMVTLALTQPFAMRIVPRLPDRVQFVIRERER